MMMVEKVEKVEEEEEGDRLFTADTHSRGKGRIRKREKTRAADFRAFYFRPRCSPPSYPLAPSRFVRRVDDAWREILD